MAANNFVWFEAGPHGTGYFYGELDFTIHGGPFKTREEAAREAAKR